MLGSVAALFGLFLGAPGFISLRRSGRGRRQRRSRTPEYARRGFAELSTAATLCALLVLALDGRWAERPDRPDNAGRAVSLLLLAETGLLLPLRLSPRLALRGGIWLHDGPAVCAGLHGRPRDSCWRSSHSSFAERPEVQRAAPARGRAGPRGRARRSAAGITRRGSPGEHRAGRRDRPARPRLSRLGSLAQCGPRARGGRRAAASPLAAEYKTRLEIVTSRHVAPAVRLVRVEPGARRGCSGTLPRRRADRRDAGARRRPRLRPSRVPSALAVNPARHGHGCAGMR